MKKFMHIFTLGITFVLVLGFLVISGTNEIHNKSGSVKDYYNLSEKDTFFKISISENKGPEYEKTALSNEEFRDIYNVICNLKYNRIEIVKGDGSMEIGKKIYIIDFLDGVNKYNMTITKSELITYKMDENNIMNVIKLSVDEDELEVLIEAVKQAK